MKNRRFDGKTITVTAPVALSSGEPFVVGQLPLVATADAAQAAEVVGERGFIAKLKVHGHDGTDPAAVAAGDKIYCDNATSVANGRLQKHTAHPYFGIALGPVNADAKTEIDVFVGNP